jgi:hypothetical protein
MKRLRVVAAAGLVTVFLLSGAAFAQWQGAQGTARMSCQDRFDALDTNHDGKLTMEEFVAAPHHRGNPEERFKSMDVKGRGYITKDEFCSHAGRGRHGMGQGPGQDTNQ